MMQRTVSLRFSSYLFGVSILVGENGGLVNYGGKG